MDIVIIDATIFIWALSLKERDKFTDRERICTQGALSIFSHLMAVYT